MTSLLVNGIQLHYEVSGTGDALLLVGGVTANCREWLRMSDRLSQRFTVYRPENRGSGQTTGWTAGFSIEQMADDLSMLITQLNLGSVYVVGHSMGGAIAQRLCIQYPHQVKAVILASSFAHFPTAAQRYLENTSTLFEAGLNTELVLRTIYTRLYGSEFLSHETNVQAELQRMQCDPTPQTPLGYQAQVQALAAFDSRADLTHIQCPTLIINGTEDVLTPGYLSEALQHAIPHATLQLIPHCGHMIPHEKPEQFSACILDFFK